MKPTSLYLLSLIEIYIFDHIGQQKQDGIVHSENQVFFFQNCHEIVKYIQFLEIWPTTTCFFC